MTPETPREAGRHQPGDWHTYPQIECEVCGQRGMVTVSIEPQRDAAPATGLPAASGLRAARDYAESLHDDPIKYGSPLDAARNTARSIMVFIDNQLAAADRAERGLPLDVAWAEAEAVLPEGWWLRGVWQWADPYEGAYWRAEAENFGPDDGYAHFEETGDSPAAALHALAAALAADPQSPTGEG